MKTKFKIGDPIITSVGTKGWIKDIEERSDGSIWYNIFWDNQKITHNHHSVHYIHSSRIESSTELNTKLLRNRTLSKILDK